MDIWVDIWVDIEGVLKASNKPFKALNMRLNAK